MCTELQIHFFKFSISLLLNIYLLIAAQNLLGRILYSITTQDIEERFKKLNIFFVLTSMDYKSQPLFVTLRDPFHFVVAVVIVISSIYFLSFPSPFSSFSILPVLYPYILSLFIGECFPFLLSPLIMITIKLFQHLPKNCLMKHDFSIYITVFMSNLFCSNSKSHFMINIFQFQSSLCHAVTTIIYRCPICFILLFQISSLI